MRPRCGYARGAGGGAAFVGAVALGLNQPPLRGSLCQALPIFLRVIAQTLQANSAAHANKAALRMGAVTFNHRFSSSLNEHVHFHVCVVDVVSALPGHVGQSSPASDLGTRLRPTVGTRAGSGHRRSLQSVRRDSKKANADDAPWWPRHSRTVRLWLLIFPPSVSGGLF